MREIKIEELAALAESNYRGLSKEHIYWLYNCIDCVVTSEVWENTHEFMDAPAKLAYNFEMAMRAPALDMMMTGFRIDISKRQTMLMPLQQRRVRLNEILTKLAMAIWGKPLNPQSPKQLADFFYGALRIPIIESFKKGQRKVSTDRDALEKLEAYKLARPFARTINQIRQVDKMISVLTTGIDADNRMRTSYNVAGTETGRWSSSENAFGTGTNLQNITGKLREIFIADPGCKIGYFDLDQAESRVVAYISDDENYIKACESGDLHTTVTEMVWPDLFLSKAGLPLDLSLEAKREIAETPFYMHWSYRDMAKRGGHGTNYYGKPNTIALHLKLPKIVIERFQPAYFASFPGLSRWHNRVAYTLQTEKQITTVLGRRRYFFARASEDATLREAIAYEPQSIVGDLLNLAMYRVWKMTRLTGELAGAKLLAQVHDAIVVQYPEGKEAEYVNKILTAMRTPVRFPTGKTMVIPSSAEVGWNWAKTNFNKSTQVEENPDGLKKWKGSDKRVRTGNAITSIMDTRF
jgi:DNA polymerase-1